MKNIYVGNIPHAVTEEQLRALFEGFGEVSSVKMITDRETGRPRGFAFVDMADADEAQKAIDDLNGKEFEGRRLTVNESRPREARPRTGGGNRGGFGGNRGGFGNRDRGGDRGGYNGGGFGGNRY